MIAETVVWLNAEAAVRISPAFSFSQVVHSEDARQNTDRENDDTMQFCAPDDARRYLRATG